MNPFPPQLTTSKITLVVFTLLATAVPAGARGQSILSELPRTGTKAFTEPYRSIDLAASEMGTLSQINVKEGQRVDQNQILGRLNEQVLNASRAMIVETIRSRGKLDAALAELHIQRETFRKIKGLFERKNASQVELDRALGQVDVAKAHVEAVRDELRIKELELKRVDAQIEQRRLRSPINGIVTNILKDEGEFVSSADPVVFKVVQLDPLLVVFSLPPSDALNLQEGQPVTLAVGIGKTFVSGIVEFVSPVAEAQSGTFRVRIRVPNSGQKLKSGIPCFFVPEFASRKLPTPNVDSRPKPTLSKTSGIDTSEQIAN